MADVLGRYNTATQAYGNSVGSANEFQKSYNQTLYENQLSESNSYKNAVAKRNQTIRDAKALTNQAKQVAQNKLAEAIAGDKEQASRVIDAAGGTIAGIQAAKAIRNRIRNIGKKENKGDNDEKGDGAGEDEGAATESQGATGGVEAAEDVSAPSRDLGPSASGSAEQPVEESMFGTGQGDFPVSQGSNFPGIVDPATKSVPDRMGIDTSQYSGLEQRDLGSVEDYNKVQNARYEAATSAEEGGGEFATESAGALAGGVEGSEGAAIAAQATEEAAEGIGSAIGEYAGAALALAPEAVALVGLGVGVYDLFHHHHHKAPPPDLSQVPKVPTAPPPPQIEQATQGATRDIANTRAEFTTPSYDSVTDTAGSISAF